MEPCFMWALLSIAVPVSHVTHAVRYFAQLQLSWMWEDLNKSPEIDVLLAPSIETGMMLKEFPIVELR